MIFSDSLSSLQAIIGSHNGSKADVLDVSEELHRLYLSGKSVEFCWIPSHVGIKGNETVDFLAKRAVTGEIDISIKVNYQDLFSDINRFVYKSFHYPLCNRTGSSESYRFKDTALQVLQLVQLRVIHSLGKQVLPNVP